MKINWRKIEYLLGGGSIVGLFITALLGIWVPGFPALKTFGTLIVFICFAWLLKTSNDKDENIPD